LQLQVGVGFPKHRRSVTSTADDYWGAVRCITRTIYGQPVILGKR
jgi:hypothetical protein